MIFYIKKKDKKNCNLYKMKKKLITILFLLSLTITLYSQDIPKENLETQLNENTQQYSKSILENEIKGIHVSHVALTSENPILDQSQEGYKIIYLFIKGKGNVIAENTSYDIVPETILLPNIAKNITIKTAKNDTLHYLKISSKLTAQDLLDLKELPKNLDSTDGLAAAVCHFYNQGKVTSGKSYTGWSAFVKQNESRVKK